MLSLIGILFECMLIGAGIGAVAWLVTSVMRKRQEEATKQVEGAKDK